MNASYDNVEQSVQALLHKYDDLVWYARKPPRDTGYWLEYPEADRKDGYDAMTRVEELYPKETANLAGAHGNWEHGFNCGMLAALRYVLAGARSPEFALERFPDLDT